MVTVITGLPRPGTRSAYASTAHLPAANPFASQASRLQGRGPAGLGRSREGSICVTALRVSSGSNGATPPRGTRPPTRKLLTNRHVEARVGRPPERVNCTQGAKTFDTRGLARDFKHELLAQVAADSWTDPRRGRILFDEWADHWLQLWASSPRRSPKGMETTESHLRCHLRPYLGRRQLRQITPSIVLRWRNELEGQLSHSGMMACRSILLRILEAARRERLIPTNPVRDVEAPRPRINPDRIFGHECRRTFTPEEFGRFLAACRPFYRDHFLAQIGTGLRSGELLGLRRRHVTRSCGASRSSRSAMRPAGSAAASRPSPRARPASAWCRCASRSGRPSTASSRPAAGPTIWCFLARVPATASREGSDPAVDPQPAPGLPGRGRGRRRGPGHLDLHGPHDLRHTFATWLEDAGIPRG